MPLEWIAGYLAVQAVGALVKPVIEDFAKDLAADIAKDQAKGWLGKAAKLVQKDAQEKAIVKAVKELVQVIDEELISANVPAAQTIAWANDIKAFLRTKDCKTALTAAFDASNSAVDSSLLKQGWRSLGATGLPDDFDWDFVAKKFTRKLRSLREEDNDLRQIVEAQAVVDTADHTHQALGVQPDFRLKLYREALLERYANLHFDSVDTSGANYSGVKLWSVFVPQTVRETREYLPHVQELPKEHLRRLIERGELDGKDIAVAAELLADRQRAYFDQAPRSVLELIADERLTRFVVLGDPGAGKSSLLRHIALAWALCENLRDREALPLPLLIELKEYDHWSCPNGKSFVRYLHDAQNWHRLNQLDLDARLQNGQQKTILLLDGLDEIFDQTRRSAAINDIQRFSNEYPNTRVIVTSRVIGYKPPRLTDAEFQHFLLQDLDDDQINDFLDRWHDTTFSDVRDRDVKKKRLAKAISDSKAIHELAGNPLLLTMMAILNRNQELPRERITLYEQASKLLLHQWDVERALVSHPELKGFVGPKEKAEMLREIAYAMQSAPEGLAGNLINEDELLRILETYLKDKLGFQQPRKAARELIEQLRERNFILCFRGGDSYSFVHRTFLEYFCATAIHQQFVQKLDLDYLRDEIYGPHWQDEKWHETLCLIAGQIGESSVEHVGQIIEFLLQQKDDTIEFYYLFLAVRCCQEIRNPRLLGKTLENTRSALESLLHQKFPKSPLKEFFLHRKVAAMLVNEHIFDIPFKLLIERTRNADFVESSAMLMELLSSSSNSADFISFLKECATVDDDPHVRSSAIQALTQRKQDSSDILSWLKQIGVEDSSPIVRKMVIRTVLKDWKSDPSILFWAKDRAVQDTVPKVRIAVMRLLIHEPIDVPGILPWIKERARQDSSSEVRQAMLKELVIGWKEDSETLPFLKERATKDAAPDVRQVALKELARSWHHDLDIMPFLQFCAAQDQKKSVRNRAQQLAAEIEGRRK